MSALSEDEVADLARKIAELREQLRSAVADRDAAVEEKTAATLEQFRLQTELRAASDRQKASAEILRSIGATSGVAEHALRQIAETTAHFFNAPSVTIRIAEGDRWVQDIRVGSGSLASGAHPGSPLIERGASLPATVYRENRQIHIPDLDNIDPSMAHWPAVATRAVGIRTISGTPLRREGQAIGALIIYRDRLAPFTDEELALQQSFADQAVIAIENARLFNETKEALERQTATSDILRVINNSTGNLAPVFECILEKAHHFCGAPCGSLQLFEGDRVLPVAIRGMTEGFANFLRAGYPITEAMRSSIFASSPVQRVEFAALARAHPDETSLRAAVELGHIGTMATVPLVKDGTTFGRIVAARQEIRAFTDKQMALLQSFADQAVIAIENARLFNETQEALERQTATADILKVIASSPSDVKPVFEAIAARTTTLVGGFSSTVFRFIDGMAHLEAFTPTTPEADEILKSTFPRPVGDFAPFRMTQAGEVMQIPDTEALTDELLDISRARGFRSMVFAPLVNKGSSIGFIATTRVQPGGFSDHHVQLLRTFADQAVIAIENARLFNEVRAKTRDLEESLQQQTATSEVLQVISSSPSDLAPVFEKMLENATRVCGAEFGSMNLVEDGSVRQAALYNAPAAFAAVRANQVYRQPHPESTLAIAIRTRQVVHVADLRTSASYREHWPNTVELVELGGARSTMIVPMLRDDEVIGVITIYRQQVHPFSDKQIELVRNFARQAVIAIENARLLRELRQRTSDLSKSLDDLRKAQDRLVQTEKLASLGQLTAGIAHEIKNPLNFVNNFSALSIELTDELNDLLRQATLADKLRDDVDELTTLLKDNLDKVVQHGKRADSIVKNMLLHSREGSGEHRPSDVNALVEESLNLAYHGARAEKPQFNVNLQRDFDPEAGMIEVFPQEITRVLLNLISNGFYAVTKRKADDGSDDFEPLVTASTKGSSSHVEIRIRDNGTGIPPEVKEKMFNPFFTTKPAGEGTGLGLSMSHDIIVKQHGGTIDVDTELGAFTEFTIVLPRTKK